MGSGADWYDPLGAMTSLVKIALESYEETRGSPSCWIRHRDGVDPYQHQPLDVPFFKSESAGCLLGALDATKRTHSMRSKLLKKFSKFRSPSGRL